MTNSDYDLANAGKASFEWTYNRLDPRSYFQTLGALDYDIPARAAPVFLKTFDAYSKLRRRSALTVLDLGCSYGINAAVLKYGQTMVELRDHYLGFDDSDTAPIDVLHADQARFSDHHPERDLTIIGIDRAQFAAAYGFWAGFIDDAIPENLETDEPSPIAADLIARCDVVISTGVVGYVTERTFARIAACQPKDQMPWIASFVLRMFDYGPVSETLAGFGYVTEKLSGRYFRQRRFADASERRHVEKLLAKRNLCVEGLESEGHFLAEFYLSRPEADFKALPLRRLLP